MNYTEVEEKRNNISISIPIPRKHNNLSPLSSSSSFEIRLFYVRISPFNNIATIPDHLTILHLRREIGVAMEINGSRISNSDKASLILRRDRVDREAAEVTYVSTDSIRLTGAVDFEVYERDGLMLCGSLERMDCVSWSNGGIGESQLDKDPKTGWSMDCYIAAGAVDGALVFSGPKVGVSCPSIEVYVAGCCSGVPLILTKTIVLSPRRKGVRHGGLDAIPEDDAMGKECGGSNNGNVRHRNFQVTDTEVDDYDPERKLTEGFYSEEYYTDEDGQLTWFNAGVRVGVGISLGMCLGIGIGAGLLISSYQATTRTLRRRFF